MTKKISVVTLTNFLWWIEFWNCFIPNSHCLNASKETEDRSLSSFPDPSPGACVEKKAHIREKRCTSIDTRIWNIVLEKLIDWSKDVDRDKIFSAVTVTVMVTKKMDFTVTVTSSGDVSLCDYWNSTDWYGYLLLHRSSISQHTGNIFFYNSQWHKI